MGGGSQWGSRVLLMRAVAWGRSCSVGGVDHELTCSPQGPGGMQVLERWQIAAYHLLSRANETLQYALVLGSGSSVTDGDGGGEDGLHDGGEEVHYHCL